MTLRATLHAFSAAAILIAASLPALAQQPAKSAAPQGQEKTITGCLNTGGAGQYVLTDQQTGQQTIVTGPAELAKHSSNHTVKLTGTETSEGGRNVFQVSKIEHVAATCQAEAGHGEPQKK